MRLKHNLWAIALLTLVRAQDSTSSDLATTSGDLATMSADPSNTQTASVITVTSTAVYTTTSTVTVAGMAHGPYFWLAETPRVADTDMGSPL